MKEAVGYSEEIAEAILDGLIEGRTLTQICSGPSMPTRRTVINWTQNDPAFAKRYDQARELMADTLVDQILDIADGRDDEDEATRSKRFLDEFDTTDLQKGTGRPIFIAERQMRIEARKYIAGKMKPRKYGAATQVEVVGDPTRPITTITRIEIVAPHLPGLAAKVIEHEPIDDAVAVGSED